MTLTDQGAEKKCAKCKCSTAERHQGSRDWATDSARKHAVAARLDGKRGTGKNCNENPNNHVSPVILKDDPFANTTPIEICDDIA